MTPLSEATHLSLREGESEADAPSTCGPAAHRAGDGAWRSAAGVQRLGFGGGFELSGCAHRGGCGALECMAFLGFLEVKIL